MAPEHERKIVTDCYRQGLPLPKKIQEAPELRMGLELFLDAFFELNTCRQIGMGVAPIPWTCVKDYAVAYDLDDVQTEDLFHHIRLMDQEFIKHHSRKADVKVQHGKPKRVQ